MNKTIMITGANAGIGKDTARQLALKEETEKIYLACRDEKKALEALIELEEKTGKRIFEIIIMDVSDPDSVRKASAGLREPVDALIMNAGGMGGKEPGKITKNGVTSIFAANILGHAVLVDELLKAGLIKNVVLFASSEAARGVKKMGIKSPNMSTASVEEFESIFDGSYFGNKFDPMQAYSYVKYTGSLWMSALSRKYPEIKFISMSPGGTRGTNAMKDMPFLQRFFYNRIAMPILFPMLGMAHRLEVGAKRYVDGINNGALKSGVFYASKQKVLTGPVIDQSSILPDLKNTLYQDNANKAIHNLI